MEARGGRAAAPLRHGSDGEGASEPWELDHGGEGSPDLGASPESSTMGKQPSLRLVLNGIGCAGEGMEQRVLEAIPDRAPGAWSPSAIEVAGQPERFLRAHQRGGEDARKGERQLEKKTGSGRAQGRSVLGRGEGVG
jgi:hypothetical protein